MNKRPDPIRHMLTWGFMSGFLLPVVYIVIILDLSSGGTDLKAMETLLNPLIWVMALRYGAVGGIVIGLITGLNLWYNMRKVNLPYISGKIDRKAPEIYATTLALTTVVSFLLISMFFSSMTLFFLAPPFIGAVAATYATHRYLSGLRVWGASIEKRTYRGIPGRFMPVSRATSPVSQTSILTGTIEKQDFQT